LNEVRRLIDFLPSNNLEDAPLADPTAEPERCDPGLSDLVPQDPAKTYDMEAVIQRVVDDGDFMEVQQVYARNIIVGFARLNGRSVGIVGQQPAYLAGVLDIDASTKAARFVRFCDAFNIPLVTLIDVTGFLPGIGQEHSGIIRHGAKLIYAYAEATVPKLSVMIRKGIGGAYVVMSSKHLRGDINFAWPGAEVAVMGAAEAVNIIHREQLQTADDPAQLRIQLEEEYREKFSNPYVAASRGYIDDVIDPSETRPRLISALEMLQNKRDIMPAKKHGNIPL
jgi:acetyl-CoA carboxylase carboxyltransferase component